MSVPAVLKRPSAWLPVVMSVTALATVLGSLALFGVHRDADEGAAAHVWQLLMAFQAPIVAWFLVVYLPKAPRQALGVLALQLLAALAALAPVYLLRL